MDMQYITPEVWKQFISKFPSAYDFLIHQSLLHEREVLTNEIKQNYLSRERRSWVTERLELLSILDQAL